MTEQVAKQLMARLSVIQLKVTTDRYVGGTGIFNGHQVVSDLDKALKEAGYEPLQKITAKETA